VKSLKENIKKIIDDHYPLPVSPTSSSSVPISSLNVPQLKEGLLDDILAAIEEYVQTFQELECMLLEILPNAEASLKVKVNDNCSLVYSIKKE